MPTHRPLFSIAISRSAIAYVACLGAVTAALAGCSDPTTPTELSVSAVAVSEGQSAIAGNALPVPLSVKVQNDGVPMAGINVRWEASAGTIAPASSATDVAGRASATWTLGPVAGTMTVSTTVAGAHGSPVTFHATALPPPARAIIVAASNGQKGMVGTALSQPLRVLVDSNGAPKAGVAIHWRTAAGSVSPETSISDGDGIASATWTLGVASGLKNADATIEGAQTSQVFSATALAGPAAAIQSANGSDKTSAVNHGPFPPLLAVVTDQYGNMVEGEAVTWTIESGPVAFVTNDATTDVFGRSAAIVEPSGTTGKAVVRAALPGGVASTDFALTIAPPTHEVVLHTLSAYAFVSSQNGSRNPAVDTVKVGTTVNWTLEFDYDLHGVKSVGSPSFTGGDFPYAYPSTVSVTFATPGTYAYNDPYQPTATGIVVVR